jgi:hypothetical protein
MAKIPSSKTFDVTGHDNLATLRDAFYQWLSSCGDLTGKQVVVRVAGNRARKETAVKQLNELAADSIVEGEKAPVVWEQHGYRFCFKTRKYYWNDEEIHVTANEALFLYRWLVLNDDTCKTQRYYLRNARTRLGKAFLAEISKRKRVVKRAVVTRSLQGMQEAVA